MKCKYCGSDIEKGSLYCRFCGSKLFNSRKKQISIPKPKQLKDGRWTAQLMVSGKRQSIYGNTIEEFEINARAIKSRLIEMKKKEESRTLGNLMRGYVDANRNILSPSSIRGYDTIRRNRFKEYIDVSVSDINWQRMINEESRLCSAKTLKNAWGLVTASLDYADIPVPKVNLPRIKKQELPFLNYAEIKAFLAAIHGSRCELAALLALHSLRESEFLALTSSDIIDGYIHVNKSIVPDTNNKFVLKHTTKTDLSTRIIPVMIPRLLELIPKEPDVKLVTSHPSTLLRDIDSICAANSLPMVHYHGLRRSFASLCYHLNWKEKTVMRIGGWSNMQTVHSLYIKLSQFDVDEDIENMRNYYGFTTDT